MKQAPIAAARRPLLAFLPAFLPAFLLALALSLGAASATHAADDPAARHRLTTAALQKIQAADAEMKKQPAAPSVKEEEADEDETVDAMVRRIDRDPRLKAVLARHGLGSREFALSVHALLHAGAYLAFEKSLDKAAAAKLYAGYTVEQRANIELMRKNPLPAR